MKSATELDSIFKKSDLILCLLDSTGILEGKNKLMSLVYIAQEECKKRNVGLDSYKFVKRGFFPYSDELQSDLLQLISDDFVVHDERVEEGIQKNYYWLTDKGTARFKRADLPKKALKFFEDVVERYKNYPFTWIAKDIYRHYSAFLKEEDKSSKN